MAGPTECEDGTANMKESLRRLRFWDSAAAPLSARSAATSLLFLCRLEQQFGFPHSQIQDQLSKRTVPPGVPRPQIFSAVIDIHFYRSVNLS
jgi:hypothetical protein